MSYGSLEILAKPEPHTSYRTVILDVATLLPLAALVSGLVTAILGGTHCSRHHSEIACRARDLGVLVTAAAVMYLVCTGIFKCWACLERCDDAPLPLSRSPTPPPMTPSPIQPDFHDHL